MGYTPQQWADLNPDFPASAQRFAYMEGGIKGNSDRLDALTPAAIGALSQATADARYVLGTAARDAVTTSTIGAAILCDGAAAPLAFATPDGGGEVTHPSVYFNPRGWGGKRYWMAVTPYPLANSVFENPCIYASDDGINWAVPAGLTNPIEPNPAGGINSDTHLIEGPDGRLYCFWRSYDPTGHAGAEERIYYRASANGMDWSDKQIVLLNNVLTRRLVSPAIVYEAGTWHMWAVDIVPSPNVVVHLTASSPTGPWSTPEPVTGLSTNAGREPWHLDVHRIGSEYVMLYMDVTLDNSDGGTLYRAVSRDGGAFTQDTEPFLVPVGGRWDSLLYRSCFLPSRVRGRDGYEVWYSSAVPAYKIGRTVAQLTDTRPRQDDPVNLVAATNLYPGWLLGDLVNRADSATAPGAATSGQTWVVDAGTLGVQSKALYLPAAANTRATIDIGVADHEIGATLTALSTAVVQQWLVARFVDGSNFLRAGLNNNRWAIEVVAAGAASSLASISAAAALPAVAGQRIRLVCKGTAVSLYVNGRLVCQATSAAGQTATKVGMQANTATVRYAAIYAKAV